METETQKDEMMFFKGCQSSIKRNTEPKIYALNLSLPPNKILLPFAKGTNLPHDRNTKFNKNLLNYLLFVTELK
jgi:hypothetical protein